MNTSIILFCVITVCIVANAWCAPAKTFPKVSKLPDSAYEPFTAPPPLPPFIGGKPFRDPLATQKDKVTREYLLEMVKSLIIQGYLPYVVMDDLKKFNEKGLIDKAIKGHSNAAKRTPLFSKFRRVIINDLTAARENLNQESHEESSELWNIFAEHEQTEEEE